MLYAAVIALSVISVFFIFSYFKVMNKLKVVNAAFIDLFESHNAMQDFIESNYINNNNDIHKENFIKFLSDSRDWAFDYIENVQDGLKKFVNDVDPSIDHFNNYGDVIWTPLTESMQKISSAYEELKTLLPVEKDENV